MTSWPRQWLIVTYNICGLNIGPDGAILERDAHILEVTLTLGYSARRAPQCRMLTSVFHPNFDEASVCVGDLGCNTKSPLNGLAAKWAAQHLELLPLTSKKFLLSTVTRRNNGIPPSV